MKTLLLALLALVPCSGCGGDAHDDGKAPPPAPTQAVWIFEQLGKPAWLRMVYDYSHYAYRGLPLKETIQTALPYMAHVAARTPSRTATRK